MFFRCNNMYQPVPSTFSLHCKRFTYISILCFSAFLFSYRPSSSGGPHLHIITPNIAYHGRKHMQSRVASPKTQREEKKLLDEGGCFWDESCFSRLVLVAFHSFFGPRGFHTKLQTFWKGKGYHFVLSFRFSFLAFSLAHFPPYPAISQEACINTKSRCVFPITKKRTFLSKLFLRATVILIETCIGCACTVCTMQVGFFSLLHVTWFVSFANSQQATVDRYTTAYIMRCTSKHRESCATL